MTARQIDSQVKPTKVFWVYSKDGNQIEIYRRQTEMFENTSSTCRQNNFWPPLEFDPIWKSWYVTPFTIMETWPDVFHKKKKAEKKINEEKLKAW